MIRRITVAVAACLALAACGADPSDTTAPTTAAATTTPTTSTTTTTTTLAPTTTVAPTTTAAATTAPPATTIAAPAPAKPAAPAPAPKKAAPKPAPIATGGACPNLRPYIAKYWPAGTWPMAERIAKRESGCGSVLHAYRASTRDDSFTPWMLNRWGSLDAWWTAQGFSRGCMVQLDCGTRAAAHLYRQCGWGPWTKPYSCR